MVEALPKTLDYVENDYMVLEKLNNTWDDMDAAHANAMNKMREMSL